MPGLYLSSNPYAGLGASPMPGPARRGGPGGFPPPPTYSGTPGQLTVPASTTTPASNVLGPQAIRPTGDPKGYDPSYLQNLATAIGGLFSRPGGNLNFNPLGNLSEISPPSGMEGNAPLPGLPSTWLQDALNGLGFSFAPPVLGTMTPGAIGSGRGDNGGRGRGPRSALQ